MPSIRRISSQRTSESTTVSKILLNGYAYTRPLLVLPGGDTNTKVLYLPMVLEPAPLTWLESLTRESIHSWEDLKKAFVDNFQRSLQ